MKLNLLFLHNNPCQSIQTKIKRKTTDRSFAKGEAAVNLLIYVVD